MFYEHPGWTWPKLANAFNKKFKAKNSRKKGETSKGQYETEVGKGVDLERVAQWAYPSANVSNWPVEQDIWLFKVRPHYDMWQEIQQAFNRRFEMDVDFEVIKSHYLSKRQQGYTLENLREGTMPASTWLPVPPETITQNAFTQQMLQEEDSVVMSDVSGWPLAQDMFVFECTRNPQTSWPQRAAAFNEHYGTSVDAKGLAEHWAALFDDDDIYCSLLARVSAQYRLNAANLDAADLEQADQDDNFE